MTLDVCSATTTVDDVPTLAVVQLAADDDCSGVLTSCVTVSATAGQLYAIQVDGYNGNWGPVVLRVSEAAPPNDNFARSVHRPIVHVPSASASV